MIRKATTRLEWKTTAASRAAIRLHLQTLIGNFVARKRTLLDSVVALGHQLPLEYLK